MPHSWVWLGGGSNLPEIRQPRCNGPTGRCQRGINTKRPLHCIKTCFYQALKPQDTWHKHRRSTHPHASCDVRRRRGFRASNHDANTDTLFSSLPHGGQLGRRGQGLVLAALGGASARCKRAPSMAVFCVPLGGSCYSHNSTVPSAGKGRQPPPLRWGKGFLLCRAVLVACFWKPLLRASQAFQKTWRKKGGCDFSKPGFPFNTFSFFESTHL